MISAPSSISLYEQDYVEWLDVTLGQLQNRDVKHLDWTNLMEEVEALGSEQRHKVESYQRTGSKTPSFRTALNEPSTRVASLG